MGTNDNKLISAVPGGEELYSQVLPDYTRVLILAFHLDVPHPLGV